jgi:hypothetical protein
MPFFFFIWNDEIIAHLEEHGISQADFERVVCNPESKGHSRSSGLPASWGYATDGRYILAVYEELEDGSILPVTAFEVPEPK